MTFASAGEPQLFYQRARKEFGKQPEFQEMEAEQLVDLQPDTHLKAQHVVMNPHETEIQNVPSFSETATNTERVTIKHQGQKHEEGGWPAQLDTTDFDEKAKHCKKAERDDNYIGTCRQLIDRGLDKNLKQNNAIDIYGSFFNSAKEREEQEAASAATEQAPPSAKTVAVFKDPAQGSKRAAVKLSWLQDGRHLAVAYCHLRFQASVEGQSTKSHIWDVTNPNEPLISLDPPSPLTCIEYYTKDPHLIAGGSYNGVVQYWDTRNPQRPVARSEIEHSHKDAVWDIKWLQSRQGEFISVSTDGNAYTWDLRKDGSPAEIVSLLKNEKDNLELRPKTNENGPRGVLGGTCLDYDAQVGGPQKFMVGTEQGTILNCNRKHEGAEKILPITFNGHHGPVYSVQRNPAHNKYFLTIGDWTARLWAEEIRGPALFTTFYHRAHLTSGCWHPHRCGVFFTTRMDGVVDIWDLTYRQSSAVLSLQVSDYALHTIRPTSEGHFVAVGGVDGSTSLLELSSSLYTAQPQEKGMMAKLFENEAQRDKNLASRQKATKKQKQNQAKAQQQEQSTAATSADEAALESAASSFLESVRAEEAEQQKSVAELKQQRLSLLQKVEDGLDIEVLQQPGGSQQQNVNASAAAAAAAG